MFIQSDTGKEYEDVNDSELCLAVQKGNADAFSELFMRHYNSLYKYGMSFYYDEDLVKDGIQSLFLRLWRKKEYLSEVQSARAYLLISLRRILLRNKEREAARDKRNSEYMSDHFKRAHTVEQDIINSEVETERQTLLEAALHTLTPRQREAFLLRLQHGLDNEEIADVMEITQKRVIDLIYHATKRIKEDIHKKIDLSIL